MGGNPLRDPGQLPSLEDLVWDAFSAERLKKFREEVDRQRQLTAASELTAGIRAKIADVALKHRGSHDWNKSGLRRFEGPQGQEAYGPGHNKCNLFVYEMLVAAGARVELEVREDFFGYLKGHPPLAGQWADPSFAIPGFEVLKVPPDSPQPGDVAAIKNVSWDASGHVGIVVGPPGSSSNMTVSARADGVVHNDWGFRPENQGEVVFRRYVGWPEHTGSENEPAMRTSGSAKETVPPVAEKPRERNRCSARTRGSVPSGAP